LVLRSVGLVLGGVRRLLRSQIGSLALCPHHVLAGEHFRLAGGFGVAGGFRRA